MSNEAANSAKHELVLTRILNAPREKVYRCWVEPELIKQWFAPKPWTTPHAELDVRPGGTSLVVMRSPEGQDYPNRGIYLEVIPNEKLVFTDAYTSAWQPSEKPFFTGIVTFEDAAPEGRSTPLVHFIGQLRPEISTRKWAFTRDGGNAPNNLSNLQAAFEERKL